MPADLTREEIAFAREFGPQSPVMKRVIDAAEAHRDEPTRLAAARAKGYREGVAKAEQWCRVQAYCANRREQEADTDRAQTAERIVKQTLNHAADCFLQIASEPPPAKPAQPDGGWIEWKGGECPVEPDAVVEVRMRDGRTATFDDGAVDEFWWGNDGCSVDILAYRIVKPAEPSAPVAPDERRALNAEVQDYMIACGQHAESRRVAEARITALEAENATLREVAAAVAKASEGIILGHGEADHEVWTLFLKIGDLRRARALVQGQGGGDHG